MNIFLDHLAVGLRLRCQLQLVDDTTDSLHRRDASNDGPSLVFVLDRSSDGRIATSNSRIDSCPGDAFLHQFAFDILEQRFVGDLVSKRHDSFLCETGAMQASSTVEPKRVPR